MENDSHTTSTAAEQTTPDPVYRAATQILAMAQNADHPSHSPQGRSNAWAGLGGEAVRLLREAMAEAGA